MRSIAFLSAGVVAIALSGCANSTTPATPTASTTTVPTTATITADQSKAAAYISLIAQSLGNATAILAAGNPPTVPPATASKVQTITTAIQSAAQSFAVTSLTQSQQQSQAALISNDLQAIAIALAGITVPPQYTAILAASEVIIGTAELVIDGGTLPASSGQVVVPTPASSGKVGAMLMSRDEAMAILQGK